MRIWCILVHFDGMCCFSMSHWVKTMPMHHHYHHHCQLHHHRNGDDVYNDDDGDVDMGDTKGDGDDENPNEASEQMRI